MNRPNGRQCLAKAIMHTSFDGSTQILKAEASISTKADLKMPPVLGQAMENIHIVTDGR